MNLQAFSYVLSTAQMQSRIWRYLIDLLIIGSDKTLASGHLFMHALKSLKKETTSARLKSFHGLDNIGKTGMARMWGVDALTPAMLKGRGRIGVVTNQACSTAAGQLSVEAVIQACRDTTDAEVACIFGPQHGFFQTEQDNMIESRDTTYTSSTTQQELALFSLYGQHREPTPSQLELVDCLVVDLQDIGCRIYTFMYTLANCLRAASRSGRVSFNALRPLGWNSV
eukprot:g24745.t1